MEQPVDGTEWHAVAARIALGVAHDINNRLLALMGLRELAEEGLDSELLRLFDDELARLDASNRLLRRLAEPPAGEDVLEAGTLLDGVRDLHARNSALRAVATEWSVDPALPALRIDPVLAERALVRVLDASGRAAVGARGVITVRAGEERGALVLEISPPPAAEGGDGGAVRALEAAGASPEAAGGALRVRFAPA